MIFKRILIIFILFFYTYNIFANDSLTVQRPKVGLVLSGGGAKGIAHIGILKQLEALGIYPDYITGTSMGSIIGGLYSIGYSIEDLEKFVTETKWGELMTGQISNNKISIVEKEDLDYYFVEIPIVDKKVNLSTGLLEGRNLGLLFSNLTFCTAGTNSFDDYPIPFRCYGVDILDCKLVEFSEGSLAQAMRASMAIPLVFSPVIIENSTDTLLVVDGGVLHNFPVEDVRKMGADIVIGSYTGTDNNVKLEDVNSIAKIAGHTLMFGGVVDSRKQTEMVDYLITPNLQGFGTGDFTSASKILRIGEESVEPYMQELKALADSLNQFGVREKPKPMKKIDSIFIDDVKIIGIENTQSSQVASLLGIYPGEWVSVETIEKGIADMYSTMLFNIVNYKIETDKSGRNTLLVKIEEKGNASIKIGGYFDDVYNLGITFKYTHHNLWTKNYKASVFLNVNKCPGTTLSIDRGLNKSHSITAQSKALIYFEKRNTYSGRTVLNEIKYNHLLWHVIGVNSTVDWHTMVGVSLYTELFRLKIDNASAFVESIDNQWCNSWGFDFYIKHNSLDKNLFATKGGRWNFLIKTTPSANQKFQLSNANADSSKTVAYIKSSLDYERYIRMSSKTTLITSLDFGVSSSQIISPDVYYIGGYRYNLRYSQTPFIGMKLNQVQAHNYGNYGMELRQQFIKNCYLVVKCNAMATYNRLEDLKEITEPAICAVGAGVGVLFNTPIGPISFVGADDSYSKKPYYYFSLGYNLPFIE